MVDKKGVREHFSSRIGFILSVAGSAIGLANIWRFPHLVGTHGGALFIFIYILALIFVGFPSLVAECVVGKETQSGAVGAFRIMGEKEKRWFFTGYLSLFTGFFVSAFYSVVAGWIFGYFILSLQNAFDGILSLEKSKILFLDLSKDPFYTLFNHAAFMGLSLLIVSLGVKQGIERANRVMLPALFFILTGLCIFGLSREGGINALVYLFLPSWDAFRPEAVLAALGQAFFTLSVGQGTMIAYGSYLHPKTPVAVSCVWSSLMDLVVSILAAIAVFTIIFSVGASPEQGSSLIFQTLPFVFGSIWGGKFLAIFFFMLVLMAAFTSQISALEPAVSYLIDTYQYKRKKATLLVGGASFILGIPCALSFNFWSEWHFFGMGFLDLYDFIASHLLIPMGGLASLLLLRHALSLKGGWHRICALEGWKKKEALFFWLTWRFVAPIMIIIVWFQYFL